MLKPHEGDAEETTGRRERRAVTEHEQDDETNRTARER
jgi:hypothetical protein